jgi:putative Mn2+ efflux pump MntP
MDAMSVSAAIGTKWHGPRQRFRLAWHMGLFQFAMPLIGWALGSTVAARVASYGKWLAAALVAIIGLKMLYEAIESHPAAVAEEAEHAAERIVHVHPKDPTRGWSLMVLSVATSVDALVVGFSLAVGGDALIWLPSLVIGVTAGAMSLLGVMAGRRFGKALGRPAEIVGAVVLLLLAVGFVVL